MMTLRRQKSRRTQLERRNKTQAAILSAAIDLLAEHGYAGFSASRVAAGAGVSRGAQEHYFPKKNDLISAATRYAMREAVDYAQLLARIASESKDPIAKFLKDSEHFFFRPVYQAMIEIMIAARSDRALAQPGRVGRVANAQRHLDRHAWCRRDLQLVCDPAKGESIIFLSLLAARALPG